MSDAERTLRDRQSRLTRLANTPEWGELKAEVERKQKRFLHRHVSALMGGQPVAQQELDRVAAFMAGVRWALSVPEQAEASLEKAIKRAQATKGDTD